jgi:hypothetical protein
LNVFLKEPEAEVTQTVGPDYYSINISAENFCKAQNDLAKARTSQLEKAMGLAAGTLGVVPSRFVTFTYDFGEGGIGEYYRCALGYYSKDPTLQIQWHTTEQKKGLGRKESETACRAEFDQKLSDPTVWMGSYRADSGIFLNRCWVTWIDVIRKIE